MLIGLRGRPSRGGGGKQARGGEASALTWEGRGSEVASANGVLGTRGVRAQPSRPGRGSGTLVGACQGLSPETPFEARSRVKK